MRVQRARLYSYLFTQGRKRKGRGKPEGDRQRRQQKTQAQSFITVVCTSSVTRKINDKRVDFEAGGNWKKYIYMCVDLISYINDKKGNYILSCTKKKGIYRNKWLVGTLWNVFLCFKGPVIIYHWGEGAEDLGLNKVKFSRSPLWMLLHWSDPP